MSPSCCLFPCVTYFIGAVSQQPGLPRDMRAVKDMLLPIGANQLCVKF